jgi:hypothetical protein
LVEVEKAKSEDRLFGIWKCISIPNTEPPASKEYWYIFIGGSGDKAAPPGIMKAIEIRNNSDRSLKLDQVYFFVTTVGQDHYAHLMENVRLSPRGSLEWDKTNCPYYLLKYRLEKDELTIWLFDWKAAQAAVEKGRLKGKINERGFLKFQSLEITETKDGLIRFLTGGGSKTLFPDSDKMVFARVN